MRVLNIAFLISVCVCIFLISSLSASWAKRKCFVKGKPAPDLVIVSEGTNIKWSGKCNAVSPKIVGSIIIKNIGTAPAKSAKSSLVSVWDINNEKCIDESGVGQVIKPGEKYKREIKACRFIAGQNLDGKRKIKIKIDRDNQINECNERNNSWPGTIEIELSCSS